MVRNQPSPRVALQRWLAQLHYNAIRNIETVFPTVLVGERERPLRGFQIADDLVLTRKRSFCKFVGAKAVPMSIEEVAANYNLEAMQSKYRAATEMWKSTQRKVRQRLTVDRRDANAMEAFDPKNPNKDVIESQRRVNDSKRKRA